MSICTVSVQLFSGRPDPTWELGTAELIVLEAIWANLTPSTTTPQPPPVLGYRGIKVICPDKTDYFAFNGDVMWQRGQELQWRSDRRRQFERHLLSTAPSGLIPAGAITF